MGKSQSPTIKIIPSLHPLIVPIADLHEDPSNARKGHAIDRIAASLKQYGQRKPIVVNRLQGNKVEAGNGTLQAAKSLGWTEIAAVFVEDDAATAAAFGIADNRVGEFSEWDADILGDLMPTLDGLMTGFTDKELKAILPQRITEGDTEPQIDKAEELRVKWNVQTGQMWRLGEHRIICGDCTDASVVARVMDGEKADCVFTSPPYAVGVDYGDTYQDTIDNLRAMLPKLSKIWIELLRPGGFAVINFGDIISAQNIVGTDSPCEYPMALEYWPIFRADGWALWSRRIWCKPGAGTGSMQCISSNRAATNWEHLWTWRKDGPPMFTKQTTGKYPSQNGWIDSTHDEGLEYGLKVHGAGMPPLPAIYSVSNHSLPDGIVFEPFSGSGTTLIACENLGRKCRAVEISPGYVAVAIERWAQHTGREPELVS